MSSTPTISQSTVGDASETTKTSEDITMPVTDMASLQVSEITAKYECCICGDELPLSKGVATCAEHVMCHQCVVDAYDIALKDNEAFPAKCCTAIPFELVEHLLSSEMREAYSKKIQEHSIPVLLRIYCSEGLCSSFIPPQHFDSTTFTQTVARCTCGCVTCTACKKKWDGQGHMCVEEYDNDLDHNLRPKWLPEYSPTCRIKQCPDCPTWIQLKEACNHMRCSYCKSEFCFVCMLPWTGFHTPAGCPAYGDPPEGYDEEGFELTRRGIHFESGLDRDGLDIFEIMFPNGAPGPEELAAEYPDPPHVHEPENDVGDEPEPARDEEDEDFWDTVGGIHDFFG